MLPLSSPLIALLRRIVFLALLFALELAVVTVWLDNDQLNGRRGLTAAIRDHGPEILRAIVGFAAVFVAFGVARYRSALAQVSAAAEGSRVSRGMLVAHFGAMAAFLFLSSDLYATGQEGASSDAIAVAWLVAGLAAIALGVVAFIPFRLQTRIIAATGPLWIYSLGGGLVASFASDVNRSMWPIAARTTFAIVRLMLGLFAPVVTNTAHMEIGTKRFSIEIAPSCSGLEGIGLMLVFGCLWLAIFRRECRFPRALLLLPAGVLFVFLLNSARITALILMGNAGLERTALGGFHSQAGWIIFNLGAIGFSMAAGRSRWLTVPVPGESASPASAWLPAVRENQNSVWVLPLVAVLAAGMIAHALTADFEWLYPLRLVAAAAVLWHYRKSYAAFDWQVGWQGPAMGVLVFVLWVAMDRGGADAMPPALGAAAASARLGWIAVRTLAASVTVPFAEELAFRGYLLRRLISPAFEAVCFPLPKFPWIAVAVSSVAFGLLHGDRWFAGTVAGICYALVYVRRGRIGDTVVAHGVTNALIAMDVLAFGKWHLW